MRIVAGVPFASESVAILAQAFVSRLHIVIQMNRGRYNGPEGPVICILVALLVAFGRSPCQFPEEVTSRKNGDGELKKETRMEMREHRKEMIKHKKCLLSMREQQANLSFTQKFLAECLAKALPKGSEKWGKKLMASDVPDWQETISKRLRCMMRAFQQVSLKKAAWFTKAFEDADEDDAEESGEAGEEADEDDAEESEAEEEADDDEEESEAEEEADDDEESEEAEKKPAKSSSSKMQPAKSSPSKTDWVANYCGHTGKAWRAPVGKLKCKRSREWTAVDPIALSASDTDLVTATWADGYSVQLNRTVKEMRKVQETLTAKGPATKNVRLTCSHFETGYDVKVFWKKDRSPLIGIMYEGAQLCSMRLSWFSKLKTVEEKDKAATSLMSDLAKEFAAGKLATDGMYASRDARLKELGVVETADGVNAAAVA